MRRLLVMIFLLAAAVLGWLITARQERPLNVVLVSIDTLRPDHLGCYGYDRETSPFIDRLAAEGTRFEEAVSTTSWTLPAHAALLTSLPDPVHGVLWDNHRLDESRLTLAEIFLEAGYRTAGVFTAPYLLPRFGLAQGFEAYMDGTLYDKRLKGPDVLVASERGRTTPGALDRVREWLVEDTAAPFFLFLHLFDVHPDFDPPPPYDTLFDPSYSGNIAGRDVFHNPDIHPAMDPRDLAHLVALYDGEIRFVDEQGIARLFNILRENGVLDNTLLVITADHGEEFFEHGYFGHRNNLYDTTLKVPLIFWGPGKIPRGRVVRQTAALIDIMPTIVELAGLSAGPEAMGSSLVKAMRNEAGDAPKGVFSELTGGNLHLESFRRGGKKIIADFRRHSVEYFDLSRDPGERDPVTDESDAALQQAAAVFTKTREALRTRGQSLSRGPRKDVRMDDETRQRLESLGYIDR